jgi:hypothetical protein
MHKKVVIVGAPRSGTNMLRDLLTTFSGVTTWPCDEINYIWRHGNVRHDSDEFPASLATDSVRKYIRSEFEDLARSSNADVIVEKTCANSLRVPFVDAIIPEAKYIFICRDGIDATGSAKERWTAELDIPYLLEKVRFVPKIDLPYYGLRYLWARLYRLISREKRLAFWGPALDGLPNVLENNSLNEVCALQWQRCVDKSEEAFSEMPVDKVIRVRYEDFVLRPVDELDRILDFIGKEVDPEKVARAVERVSSGSLGKGRRALGEKEVVNLELLVGETLRRYDYL